MDFVVGTMLARFALVLPNLLAHLLRRAWLVAVVTVAICALFAAHAVAALFEADYLAPSSHAPVPRRVVETPSAQKAKPADGAFGERNMFCSTCAPVAGSGPTVASTYAGTPAVLIATSVGDDARATVHVPSTEVQGSFGLGETIPGVGMVDRIGYTSIDVVDAAGRRGTISLLDKAVAAGVAGAATPAAPPSPFADRVKKVADDSFEVDRSLVKELVQTAQHPVGMRAMPAFKDGQLVGLRFSGVTDKSIAAAIGLKSGDVLSAIDGKEIKTAQALLDIYAGVDTMSQVSLEGTRGGKPLAVKLYLR